MNKMILNDGMYLNGDECWFIDRNRAILYRFNVNNFEIVPQVELIHSKNTTYYREYQKCIVWDHYVACLPDKSNVICIYDTINNEMKGINIDCVDVRLSILEAWYKNGYLWCVSYGLSKIIKIDVSDGKYEYFALLEEDDQIGYEATIYGNKIFVVSQKKPKIVSFNIDTLEKDILNLNEIDDGFNTISIDKNVIYLTGKNNKIYIVKEKEVLQVDILEKFKKGDGASNTSLFYKSSIHNGKLVLFPWNIGKKIYSGIVSYDIENTNVKLIEIKDESQMSVGDCFVFEYFLDNKCVCFDDSTRELFYIDVCSGNREKIDISIIEEVSADMFCNMFINNVWLENNIEGELNLFLKSVVKYNVEDYQ